MCTTSLSWIGDLGWEISSRGRVPRATRTPRTFGICPSFKGHFLSPRAKPQSFDSQLLHRRLPAARTRCISSASAMPPRPCDQHAQVQIALDSHGLTH